MTTGGAGESVDRERAMKDARWWPRTTYRSDIALRIGDVRKFRIRLSVKVVCYLQDHDDSWLRGWQAEYVKATTRDGKRLALSEREIIRRPHLAKVLSRYRHLRAEARLLSHRGGGR